MTSSIDLSGDQIAIAAVMTTVPGTISVQGRRLADVTLHQWCARSGFEPNRRFGSRGYRNFFDGPVPVSETLSFATPLRKKLRYFGAKSQISVLKF